MLVWAADQESGRRHSLIHRPATGTMPQITPKQSTIAAGTDNQRSQILDSPVRPQAPSPSAPTTRAPHRKLAKRPEIATVTPIPSPPTTPSFATKPKTAGPASSPQTNTTAGTPVVSQGTTLKPSSTVQGLASTSVAPATVRPLSASLVSAPNSRTSSLSSTSSGTATPLLASGSRSAANLLQNPAIASLLQPPAPIVTSPPASQSPAPTLPPSTPPPSTSPPAPPTPTTGSAILTWSSNREPDLAGYKVYVGTQSGLYAFPGSPFTVGTVISYTLANLPSGQTYFFALSAYNNAGYESSLSAEVSKSIY
jgi:hypothetical protein